jgi:hypothetical protein
VTGRRTTAAFAQALRYGVDELDPTAEWMEVVLDNLKPHPDAALIEIFGQAEAERLRPRLGFPDTPVPGRGLNRAESEWRVMARQGTRRRWGEAFPLGTELVAWEPPRQEACVTIGWKFTTQDARRVFAKYS